MDWNIQKFKAFLWKKYLFIILMLATPAFATDWVQAGETNNLNDYIDKDSVRVKSFTGGG